MNTSSAPWFVPSQKPFKATENATLSRLKPSWQDRPPSQRPLTWPRSPSVGVQVQSLGGLKCVCVRSANVPFVFIQIIWTYLSWPSPPAMRTCVWTSTLLLKTRGSTMIGFTTSWKLKTAECTQPRYNNNNNSLCQCHVCVTQTFTPCVAFAKLRGLA